MRAYNYFLGNQLNKVGPVPKKINGKSSVDICMKLYFAMKKSGSKFR